jgi:hypothetical protein
LEAGKSKIRVLTNLVPSKGSLPGLQMAIFLFHVLTGESGRQREEGGRGMEEEREEVKEREREKCSVSLLMRTLILPNQGFTLRTSFNLNHFLTSNTLI